MGNGAEIGSLEVLKDLLAALERFSLRQREVLEELTRPLARRVEELEDRQYSWKQELSRRQADYDDADEDDDIGDLAMQVDEAEQELQKIGRWQRRVEESHAHFLRCAGAIAAGPDERAIAFLRQRLKELEEYLAVGLGVPDGPATPMPGVDVMSNVLDAARSVVREGIDGITDSPLPDGFEWVDLGKLRDREMQELPPDDDFRKVPKVEMQRGFEVLQSEILPAIRQQGADSDYFFELDRQAGRDYEHGFGRVYDAFFGSEPITLDWDLDGKGLNVTSGRHRIKVAIELGWPVVPARVIGRS